MVNRLMAQVNTRLQCDDTDDAAEPPRISVQGDKLLVRLIEVHGAHGRSDIAPELTRGNRLVVYRDK